MSWKSTKILRRLWNNTNCCVWLLCVDVWKEDSLSGGQCCRLFFAIGFVRSSQISKSIFFLDNLYTSWTKIKPLQNQAVMRFPYKWNPIPQRIIYKPQRISLLFCSTIQHQSKKQIW